jgi:hypothetical protein
MAVIDQVARDLHMRRRDLERESLRVYLNRRLKLIDSELFLLAKRYGVKDVFEFDEKVRDGKFHEEESFEDYFRFDNLQAEREKILSYLEKI